MANIKNNITTLYKLTIHEWTDTIRNPAYHPTQNFYFVTEEEAQNNYNALDDITKKHTSIWAETLNTNCEIIPIHYFT